MQGKAFSARLSMALAMAIFGTIGIFRGLIDLPSGLLAAARGVIGALFLCALVLVRRGRFDRKAIRSNAGVLILSGVLIGFNWMLLFEAYRYTSVATATLCYYMAPVFVLLVSPLVLRERLTLRRLLCVAVALLGMIPVSGVLGEGFGGWGELRGVALGLGAAVLYATVILLNQRLRDVGAYDKTIVQLATAGLALVPYTLICEAGALALPDAKSLCLTLVVCILHTGVAYALYFGSMRALPAQSVALMGYIDPVVAVGLSALLSGQRPNGGELLGALLILGATVIGELPARKKQVRRNL